MQVRVPTNVVCSISDDRGGEPTFNGVTMSTLIEVTSMRVELSMMVLIIFMALVN